MKSVIHYLAVALIAGIAATPAKTQSSINTSTNASLSAPISLEQEQTISALKDATDGPGFRRIAKDAGIMVAGRVPLKPIAEWTQGDFRRFMISARRFDRNYDQHVTEIFFMDFFRDGPGGDGGDGGD